MIKISLVILLCHFRSQKSDRKLKFTVRPFHCQKKTSNRGNGYATEGAKRCLDYAFNTLEINKVISVCTVKNEKSENVMKKLGMIKKGWFNHPELADYPEYEKHFCYEIEVIENRE